VAGALIVRPSKPNYPEDDGASGAPLCGLRAGHCRTALRGRDRLHEVADLTQRYVLNRVGDQAQRDGEALQLALYRWRRRRRCRTWTVIHDRGAVAV